MKFSRNASLVMMVLAMSAAGCKTGTDGVGGDGSAVLDVAGGTMVVAGTALSSSGPAASASLQGFQTQDVGSIAVFLQTNQCANQITGATYTTDNGATGSMKFQRALNRYWYFSMPNNLDFSTASISYTFSRATSVTDAWQNDCKYTTYVSKFGKKDPTDTKKSSGAAAGGF